MARRNRHCHIHHSALFVLVRAIGETPRAALKSFHSAAKPDRRLTEVRRLIRFVRLVVVFVPLRSRPQL